MIVRYTHTRLCSRRHAYAHTNTTE